MSHIRILTIISTLLSASSVWAQENSAQWELSCVVMPVFHCVEYLEGGSAIGRFGYDLQCPDDAPTTAEVYIEINENNLFSLGSKDRGQPKVFVSGEHMDEFEVEVSMAEVAAGSAIQWSVKGQTAVVDFSRTKDEYVDCSVLSQ